jgi:uncharacterized membrane protein
MCVMKPLTNAIPKVSYALLAAFLVTMAVRSHNETTIALVISSLLMFACCWANATHLFGAKAALKFVLLAVTMGWFAEQMGSSYGWFFGSYTYTEVLGWRLGDVPMIIPLMWFALCYAAYVIGYFAVWHLPSTASASLPQALFMSLIAAMLVTAYDLGADPYMVFVLKAWIMTKTDGWWFGETLQGFVGWMTVSLAIVFCFHVAVRKSVLTPDGSFSKGHALLPFGIYGGSMVFQMLEGHPVETRTIAVFAMGIPLLIALAGWWRWKPQDASAQVPSPVPNARLAQSQYAADSLADGTMSRILGPWNSQPNPLNTASQFAKIAQVNRQFEQWTQNQSLVNWHSADKALPPEINTALQHYLQEGQALPAWADRAKIERAEVLFMDYGALSCTLLFCASLPECYVIPDLSAVLHAAGQLEQHTDYRIRSTAAMIFPVMMKGGLGQPDGSGVAQILKVRLIHATIRNLILRGAPADALAALGDQLHVVSAGVVQPLDSAAAVGKTVEQSMHRALFTHGWRVGADGLPCNQEELAYTLLTFGYVFLRSMRKLGLGLRASDEEAYLHCWNVVGHVLGIRRELLVDTMPQAEALLAQMQARGRAKPWQPDPRPALGAALMGTMQSAIPLRALKGFPVLMTRYLCGTISAREIGVSKHVSWVSYTLFVVGMGLTRVIDAMVRWLLPEFSISRFCTRVVGYHLMSRVLLDQTRPLKLPAHLLNQVSQAMGPWSEDAKAPVWLNAIEDRLTQRGAWTAQPQKDKVGNTK